MNPPAERTLVENRKARHDYDLTDTFEAGVALRGSEVKSLRGGRGNLREAYVQMRPDGAWLMQCHISPYEQANINNHEPTRARRLLLHRHELSKLKKATAERGMTIVPTRLYLKGSLIKLEIAVGRGRKSYDKRHALKAKDAKREMDRARRGG